MACRRRRAIFRIATVPNREMARPASDAARDPAPRELNIVELTRLAIGIVIGAERECGVLPDYRFASAPNAA